MLVLLEEAASGRPLLLGPSRRHELVVFAGCVAHQSAEVVNEVCLVGVAQVERELGAVEGMAGVEAFHELVQTVTPDNPFGRDADIVLEEPL